jgi:hypothetical protein
MIAILNGFPELLSQTPEISVKSKSNPAMTGLDTIVLIGLSFLFLSDDPIQIHPAF